MLLLSTQVAANTQRRCLPATKHAKERERPAPWHTCGHVEVERGAFGLAHNLTEGPHELRVRTRLKVDGRRGKRVLLGVELKAAADVVG